MTEQESEPELEKNADDLKQCSMIEEYDGSILLKVIDRIYPYGNDNLQVVLKNDDYFQMICEEGIG